jgi:hypothetical protein
MHPVAVAKVEQFRIAERPATPGAQIRQHVFPVQPSVWPHARDEVPANTRTLRGGAPASL